MRRKTLPLALAVALLPITAHAQAAVYQKQSNPQFHVDGLSRQEWTEELVFAPDLIDRSRRLIRLRPRLEASGRHFDAGLGGDFTYGSDRNTEPAPGAPPIALMRDNYDSRDARLDLAWIGVSPFSALRVRGGRFFMPVRFTEMIWDRDLRPQGASATLDLGQVGPVSRFALTGVYSRGGHPLPDDKPFKFADRDRFYIGSATATIPVGAQNQLELMGAYVDFADLQFVPSVLRRQNTRQGGALVLDYDVVDLVARYRTGGRVNTQLVLDYCWNTAATENNRGLWFALVLGSLDTARGSLEYVYAQVDKDATLAAYATDDFIWETGWAGHRADLGLRMSDKSSLHLVGQYQRFKDAPNEADRDLWKHRLRAEIRVNY